MPAADSLLARIGGLALLATVLTDVPALAALPAVPCMSYGPSVVDLEGILQREAFAQQPVEDLFVNPNDLEVMAEPEATAAAKANSATTGLPAATTAPAPAGPGAGAAADSPLTPVVDPAFIGPPMPGSSAPTEAAVQAPDPVLLRARPLKRPLRSEQAWVLVLRSSLCVVADPMDRINTTEKKVRKIQLVIAPTDEPALRALQKKKVVARGQLFHAVSRRHYLPVLLNVETIRPPEWIPEPTPLPPLPPLTPLPPLAPLPPLPATSR